MKKNERIEYYVLVEPKLREIFINTGFTNPSEEEFQEVNLTKKNRLEFLEYFKNKWFVIKHFSSKEKVIEMKHSFEELTNILGEETMKHVSAQPQKHLPKLQLPSSAALFQICKNIDIENFYYYLRNRYTFIAVHKETGVVSGRNVLSELSISFKNGLDIIKEDPDQYEVFEIEDHAEFCKLLEEGNFKKIKKEKLFENEIFEVPSDYPLSTILKSINLYEFADTLREGNPLIKYDLRMKWYSNFKDVNAYHSFNDSYNKILMVDGYKAIDRSKETGVVWFYAENPLQIRQEILFGNFKILKKIRVIENIFTYLPSNDV